MRKMLSMIALAGVALAILLLVAKGAFDHATSNKRETVVSQLTDRLAEMETEPSVETAPVASPPPAATDESLSTSEMRLRWEALITWWEKRYAEAEFKAAFDALHMRLHKIGEPDSSEAELSAAERAAWAAFLEDNADFREQLRVLCDPANPKVPFYSNFKRGPFHEWEVVTSAHLLLAYSAGEEQAVLEDLDAILGLAALGQVAPFPGSSFAKTLAIVGDLAERGVLAGETMERMMDRIAAARNRRRFVDECAEIARRTVALYDTMPFESGVTFRESPQLHGLMWGYRYGLTFLQNQHLTRFGEAMDEVLDIAPQPYYRAQPELERLIQVHDIVTMDEAGLFDHVPSEVALSSLVHYGFWYRGLEECFLDQTRLVLELAQYQREHGAFPAALGELGSTALVSPLTGEGYGYERRGAGYGLWFEAVRADERNVWLWPGRMLELEAGEDAAERVRAVLAAEATKVD